MYWLMKTEPEVFAFEDFKKCKNQTTFWEGVRNYKARNYMRDEFKVGDFAFIYHSGIEMPVIAGIAKVVKAGYADAAAMDSRSDYYDSDAKKKGVNPWVGVDVQAYEIFQSPVTREQLKTTSGLEDMGVLKKGNRLSIQRVTAEEFKIISKLGKPKKF